MVSKFRSTPRRRHLCWVLAALAAGAAFAVPPASASAAVTLGSTLQTEPNGNMTCSNAVNDRGCLAVNGALPGGQLVAPFDGVIVRWRVRLGAGTEAQTIRIRVLKPVGADSFTAISSSALESVPAGAGTYAFAAQLPIRSGEEVGIEAGEGTNLVVRAPLPGAEVLFYNPSPADGADTGPPPATATDAEETFNVDVEPDCDSDGLGDETQDPVLPLSEACGKGNSTLTLDANKNKVKKQKKVTLSGRLAPAARQGPCESGQTVELQRKRPSQTTYTTFTQVQTDTGGSFSLKQKVKKTFEFRAQVVETAACTAALSNSEKVKVKKKRN
jgi:hypothetical protein